ncbi:MAG: FadR/GntR family transcriptional regulator [Bacillota bacterium]|uniref:FadR family transcriptional regulator n=1 Tax=Virgibacillus salarius TaxID=447199 RepID=A0A941I8M7_9BACI|nr:MULTISPECIES: FadR/GntR family transcriptional regulator [Virgibacillus]NAZ08497.1 FCD domain-containing protein [Agaribacter marinus]MBR7795784.1 FadR family transcriptional regulator [Virgibacillus salarius]MCC2248670.1 FadR family transcriptional regulator [Virgibacillus sp. AGTR]MDY7044961.1 FadR/GntR family transcriptional regulator [Virgibacillus sp. M23]QRZ18426.1 FadR family transcriptional regulator [Virgibacillus sp. AGTR]
MLKKTNRISLVDQVVSQMENLIENGHWSIGDKVPPEMELMEEFGVSRNTLREAIHALVHAGLLETKQGSGTIVRSSSSLEAAMHRYIEKSDLLETLEVRLALEKEAAQLAAKRRSEEDINKLHASIKQCQDAAERGAMEDFIKADITFHKNMVRAANNKLLQDLYEHMTDPLYSSIRDIMLMDNQFDYNKEIHSELLDAIRHQDIDGATKYVDAYINEFKKRL